MALRTEPDPAKRLNPPAVSFGRGAIVRVLLVEDNPGDARLTQEALTEYGEQNFEFSVVPTLRDALDAVFREEYDIAVVDLSLPDTEGLEALHGIREAIRSLPIVILSGLADEERALEAVQAGAQDYIVKGMLGSRNTVRVIRYAIERKQIENELAAARDTAERASDAKSRFLANMSHELRTPLNAIIGFTELIAREAFGPVGVPQYRDYAGDVLESAYHLLEIVNDVLDLAKVEAGKLELREEEVNLADVCAAAIRMVEGRASKGGVVLAAKIGAPLPALLGERQAIKRAILNILSNAVKFTPDGGRVELQATQEADGGLKIVIIDTGIGIAPEHIPVALSPFDQIDGSLARRYEGTGLGLPIAKGLVEAHGGQLELTSALGEGTTVRIFFPNARVLAGVAIETEDSSHSGLHTSS